VVQRSVETTSCTVTANYCTVIGNCSCLPANRRPVMELACHLRIQVSRGMELYTTDAPGIRILDPKGTPFCNSELHKSRAPYRHCDYIWYTGTQYLWPLSVEPVSCRPFGARNFEMAPNFSFNLCAPVPQYFLRSPGFERRSVLVSVCKVSLAQMSLRILPFSLVVIPFSSALHTDILFTYHIRCMISASEQVTALLSETTPLSLPPPPGPPPPPPPSPFGGSPVPFSFC